MIAPASLDSHGGGPALDVSTSIQYAREWVEGYAASHPEFRGAHLMGGVLRLPKEAPFPATSDLDISLVVEVPPGSEHEVNADGEQGLPIDELYHGVPIEAGRRSTAVYSSAERVLMNAQQAANLSVDSILVDPHGLLARIQPIVAAEYARRRWVTARCEWEKRHIVDAIGRAERASTPHEFLIAMVDIVVYLCGLIAVASIEPPTHIKCLVLLRRLLHAQLKDDLYEGLLEFAGSRHLSASQVAGYREQNDAAFDRAVQVHRTPSAFDFKIRPHLRPYLVDGMKVIADQGNHREIAFWLALGLYVCTGVIRNDAPAQEAAHFEQLWDERVKSLGIATHPSRSAKVRQAIRLKDAFIALADEIVHRLPDDTPIATATEGV